MSHDIVSKRSPFFYVGDKFKLIPEIRMHFPEKINKFVEPFLGGGSVFLNVEAKKYILNDIDKNVIFLHDFLIKQSENEGIFFKKVKSLARKYNLSRSFFEDVVPLSLKKKWVKTYYAQFNREGYSRLKSDYNKSLKKDPFLLYLLLIYGFNRMLRFNKKGEFNIPVGNVDFNQNVVNALKDYFLKARTCDVVLNSQDFRIFLASQKLTQNDFVYVDPPYLISASEYNKLWGEEQEEILLDTLDELDRKGIKFALSNITTYNGKRNEKLLKWMQKYTAHSVNSNYISYHDNTKKRITEVLITNY
jgi:DNA adenine methylase